MNLSGLGLTSLFSFLIYWSYARPSFSSALWWLICIILANIALHSLNKNSVAHAQSSTLSRPYNPYLDDPDMKGVGGCLDCNLFPPLLDAIIENVEVNFIWPAKGKIIEKFHRHDSDGIDISLPVGTKIKAADGGEVAYSAEELPSYGKMILIRHPNGFVTAYAFNSELKVKKGEKVKQGDIIAISGVTGAAMTPRLHFELRRGSMPVDPVPYLMATKSR